MSTPKWYVYEVTNKINGKIYIGVHMSRDILKDRYMGSGLAVSRAIAKHGKFNFKRRILFSFDTAEEAFAKEAEIVTPKFLSETHTYNIAVGGNGRKGSGIPKKPGVQGGAKYATQTGKIVFHDPDTGDNFFGQEVPEGYKRGMVKSFVGKHAYNPTTGERRHFAGAIPSGWVEGHNWVNKTAEGKFMGHKAGETRFFDSLEELNACGFARGNAASAKALKGKTVFSNPQTKEVIWVEGSAEAPPNTFFNTRFSKHDNFLAHKAKDPSKFFCFKYGDCPPLTREEWIIGLPKLPFGRLARAIDGSHMIHVEGASPTSKKPPQGYTFVTLSDARKFPSCVYPVQPWR